MLRYLVPATAMVGLCVAIYATSLHVPSGQTPATVVPVIPQPRPPVTQTELVKPSPPVVAQPPPAVAQTQLVKPSAPVVPQSSPAAAQTQPVKPLAPVVARPPPAVAQTQPVKPLAPVTPTPPEPANQSEAARSAPLYRPEIAQSPAGRPQHLSRERAAATSLKGPPSIRDQLLSARAALTGDDPALARSLLEAAETAVVFEPGVGQQRRSTAAAAQITQALRELNGGDRVVALRYVGRALATVGSGP